MRRVGLAVAGLAFLVTVVMVVVVATAPNGYPTPTDRIWGHDMPSPEGAVLLALMAAAAVLFGIAATALTHRWRLLAGLSTCLASGCVLSLLSILTWRLHAPVSAGNGG